MTRRVVRMGLGLWLTAALGGACTGGEPGSGAGNGGGPSGGGASGSTPGGAVPANAGAGVEPSGGSAFDSGGHDSAGAGGMADDTDQGGAGGAMQASLAQLIDEYASWQALSEPYDVSVEILSLCRAPTANEEAFVASEHSGFALRHFANPLALEAIDQASTPFLEGAAIVKEKLGYRAGGDELQVLALGIMVKRSPGFDAASGDWLFAYYSDVDGILSDAATQTSCASCHASSSAKDFVFIDQQWRSGEDFP